MVFCGLTHGVKWLTNLKSKGTWNSTQELQRSIMQISKYGPALVIGLNGSNDAVITWRRRNNDTYPLETPESFEDLEKWVEDIRSNNIKEPEPEPIERL